MKPIVYLAGPIANTEAGVAFDWRDEATSLLMDNEIEVLDPMRAKHRLATRPIGTSFHEYKDRGIFYTPQGIMTRDFNDVKRADAILANLLGAKIPSLGTVMELAWAYAMQKPVVVAIEAVGNPHDNHPMIHQAMPFRVEDMLDAVRSIAIILGR